MDNLLEIKNLKTYFYLEGAVSRVIDDVSLDVRQGETVALVGESGCGKTMLALSILNLVPSPGKIVKGAINFQGRNILELSAKELQGIRGKDIAMVFQEPLSSLNPVLSVGHQIAESLVYHLGLNKEDAKAKTIELLGKVEIPEPNLRFYDYPHQLSGGMRQRAMIAMAMSCGPRLIIWDEPTTALDTTIQAQILDLIEQVKDEHNLASILITHDLAIVQDLADRVAIMYAGKVVELASTTEIFQSFVHPYTSGLFNSVPDLNHPKKLLKAIGGAVPESVNKPTGCPFHPRCERRDKPCDKEFPQETKINPTHSVWCCNPVNTDGHR